MNVKFLALAAVAASMTLVGCNKTLTPEETGVPKSVTIKLANVVPGTRSAGGEQIAEGTAVTLTSFQIFFSDGTNLYTAKQADGTTDAVQYFSGADVAGNLEGSYHLLPSAVNKVIVVGNYGSQITEKTEADLNLALKIADEQDIDDLTLYAESGLTPVTDDHSGVHDDGSASAVFEADLKVVPRIARIFITDFSYTYTTDGSAYKSLTLQKIALNNYYAANTLATQAVSDLQATAISDATAWDWLAGHSTPSWDWDDLSHITLTPTAANTAVTAESKHYYHFFVGSGAVPQLVLQCKSADDTPLYLATSGFKVGGNDVTWQNGYIYELSFAFDDEDLTSPDKCVDITVTPHEWQVETITPEF